MPLYGTSTPITHTPGHESVVWNNETLNLPTQAKSQAIYLKRQANVPNCLSVEMQFSGAPGAFQVDVEVADTDNDAYYIKAGTGLSALGNAANVARLEFTNIVAKFVRLKMATRTNSVAVTAKFF